MFLNNTSADSDKFTTNLQTEFLFACTYNEYLSAQQYT